MQMDLLSSAVPDGFADHVPSGSVPADQVERVDERVGQETLARRLEETGRFRVLRKLEHRPIALRPSTPGTDGTRLAIIVDTETTGLDHARDEVIEIGAVAVKFDEGGLRDVVSVFEGLQQPSRGLPPEVVRLTGLTDAALKGRSIDRDALAAFMRPADLVIAHNSSFDRPFCERLCGVFAEKRWCCSAVDVDWKTLGAEGTKLGQLLASVGFFHDGHRALTDAFALLEILTAQKYSSPGGAFAQLSKASSSAMYEVRAEGAPYSERGILKESGYRWDPGAPGRPKSWFKIVSEAGLSNEQFFLRYEIYRNERLPIVRKIEPTDRFRS